MKRKLGTKQSLHGNVSVQEMHAKSKAFTARRMAAQGKWVQTFSVVICEETLSRAQLCSATKRESLFYVYILNVFSFYFHKISTHSHAHTLYTLCGKFNGFFHRWISPLLFFTLYPIGILTVSFPSHKTDEFPQICGHLKYLSVECVKCLNGLHSFWQIHNIIHCHRKLQQIHLFIFLYMWYWKKKSMYTIKSQNQKHLGWKNVLHRLKWCVCLYTSDLCAWISI